MRRRWSRSWGRERWGGKGMWAPYVPVAERRAKAARHVAGLRKKGREAHPVTIAGRDIASSFWGRSWCVNLESYSDFSNRLPRGQTYVRNGSVIDLQIAAGSVESLVSGSRIYTVKVGIDRLSPPRWKSLVRSCSGRIGSLVELLQGRFSKSVMEVLAHQETGLFPKPKEIRFSCTCPDIASMCKHVAATLYGVGSRLDEEPSLFFLLRQVDGADLIEAAAGADPLAVSGAPAQVLSGSDLSGVFGIDLDDSPMAALPASAPAGAAMASPSRSTEPEDSLPARSRGRSTPRRSGRTVSDDSGDRSAVDVLFRPGVEVTPEVLLAFGIPRTTFANWVTTGVLARTSRRAVYLATAATAASIRRALLRLSLEASG